jgi:hypothetical protein
MMFFSIGGIFLVPWGLLFAECFSSFRCVVSAGFMASMVKAVSSGVTCGMVKAHLAANFLLIGIKLRFLVVFVHCWLPIPPSSEKGGIFCQRNGEKNA